MDDNGILRVIMSRRSVLRFTDAALDEGKLEAVLEAGRWAPSYINSQPWEFVVVRDLRLRSRVADVLRRVTISWQGFEQAPAIIVIAVDIATDPRHHVVYRTVLADPWPLLDDILRPIVGDPEAMAEAIRAACLCRLV